MRIGRMALVGAALLGTSCERPDRPSQAAPEIISERPGNGYAPAAYQVTIQQPGGRLDCDVAVNVVLGTRNGMTVAQVTTLDGNARGFVRNPGDPAKEMMGTWTPDGTPLSSGRNPDVSRAAAEAAAILRHCNEAADDPLAKIGQAARFPLSPSDSDTVLRAASRVIGATHAKPTLSELPAGAY